MPIVNPTAETLPERYGYALPERAFGFVGENKLTKRLLDLERRAVGLANEGGREWAKLVEAVSGEKVDPYRDGLPEALAAILNGVEVYAADAAAIGYLRRRGYVVQDKKEGI